MTIHRKYRTRSATRGSRPATPQSGIRRFLREPQHPTPEDTMAAPRVTVMGDGAVSAAPGLWAPAQASAPLPGMAAASQADVVSPARQQSRLDEELRSLLQALPTRADIEALTTCIEEAHSRDIQEVRVEIQSLTGRVEAGEASVSSLETRVLALELFLQLAICNSIWRNWKTVVVAIICACGVSRRL